MVRYCLPLAFLVIGFAAQAQPEPPLERQPDHYAPGDLVRAEFSLDERTREGGRLTPFFTEYRPNISFGGGDTVICRFVVETDGGHKPGTTGEIGMNCPVGISEGQRFEAFERRRPIGEGVVLPRPSSD